MTTPIVPAIKETKAQKTERLKLAKNPWEAFDEIRQFARDESRDRARLGADPRGRQGDDRRRD